MNSAILIGRFTDDPNVNTSNGGTVVARFRLAVDRNFKDASGNYGADFISCIVFGKTAEFVQNYFHKGMKAAVTGRIQTGDYTNRDGVKVYTTDVVCNSVEFVEKRETNQQYQPQAQAQTQYQYQAQPQMAPNAQAAPQNGFNGVPQGNYQPQFQNPSQGGYVPQNGGQPMTAQQAEQQQPLPGWMTVSGDTPELPFN